jgi:TadE-like protein
MTRSPVGRNSGTRVDGVRTCSASSNRRTGPSGDKSGVALVEFALLAPTAFLLLLGLIVVGLTVANQNLLTDGVRDTARAAAVCGGFNRDSKTQFPPPPGSSTPTICEPASTTTAWANLDTYATLRLAVLAGGGALSGPAVVPANCKSLPSGSALVCLYTANGAAVTGKDYTISTPPVPNPLDDCQLGWKIGISGQEAQPLYLPLIGHFLGDGGTNTRNITADAEATCEQ